MVLTRRGARARCPADCFGWRVLSPQAPGASKHAPYMLAEFVTAQLQSPVPARTKATLQPGLFALVDACRCASWQGGGLPCAAPAA